MSLTGILVALNNVRYTIGSKYVDGSKVFRMSGKDEAQSNELQRLISDGMTLVCAGNSDESLQSSHSQPSAPIANITDDFFMECKSEF